MTDKKAAFHEIANYFIRSMELIPTRKTFENFFDGIYHHVCSGKYFTKTDDPEDQNGMSLVSPIEAWLDFVSHTQLLFEHKVSFRRLNLILNEVFGSLKEFPFTEDQVSQYTDELYKWAERHYLSAYVAFVPVYNLSLGDGINEVPLANSVLHRGFEDSLMARLSKNVHLEGFLTIKPIVDFLAIPVSGDAETIAHIVRLEANRSLACLRFISRWTQRIGSLNYIVENDASRLTLSPNESAQFLYYDPQIGAERVGMTNTFSRSLYHINIDTLDELKNLYELDNLNYHFQSEVNPVSSRIIRALELYDSGVKAELSWQSLYRYVASINAVVHPGYSKEKEIVPRLQTLIRFGGNYVGSMEGEESLQWSVLVEKTVHLYYEFHRLRGDILHGAILHPDLEQVNKVRILANNCIRLMAKLAREFNWTTKADINRWFKNPEYPPSIRDRANGIKPP